MTHPLKDQTTGSDFPETFYESDRSAAKGHATYPLTFEYIQRLEAVARTAVTFLGSAHSSNKKEVDTTFHDLNDALATINFLDESL